jgi:hypothetical protein
MSSFKPNQRHLEIGGRAFHFVSYEGQPARELKNEAARPSMWYLMVEGRRCPAMLCDPAQPDTEVDRLLSRWATDNALAVAEPVATPAPPTRGSARKRTRR